MKKSRFTEDQITLALQKADQVCEKAYFDTNYFDNNGIVGDQYQLERCTGEIMSKKTMYKLKILHYISANKRGSK